MLCWREVNYIPWGDGGGGEVQDGCYAGDEGVYEGHGGGGRKAGWSAVRWEGGGRARGGREARLWRSGREDGGSRRGDCAYEEGGEAVRRAVC